MTIGENIRKFRERAGLSQLALEIEAELASGHLSRIENGKPFGAIVYVKKIMCDFKDEKDTLEIISRQIAVAIQNARKFGALTKNNYNGGR